MSLFTRGSFDFVVYRDRWPQFAVEFDGFGHAAPRQIERDAIKNRLCASAGFPLMRVSLDELRETEQVGTLEWLVRTFVTVEKTFDALDEELDDENPEDEPDSVDEEIVSASAYVFGDDGDAFEAESGSPRKVLALL